MICSNCGHEIQNNETYYSAGNNGTIFCSKVCSYEAFKGFYTKKEVDKTMKEVNRESNELLEINDHASNISATLETIYGQMHFFGELIADTEAHPDISALLVKNGVIQRKLNAIYSLLDSELSQIRKESKKILEFKKRKGL